jgi:hypothetical protein
MVGFNEDDSAATPIKRRPLRVPISSTSSTFDKSGDSISLDLRSRLGRVGLTSTDWEANASRAADASRS